MIKSFRHKGLKKFFETGNLAGIQASHANRLRMQLAALDTAQIKQMLICQVFVFMSLKVTELEFGPFLSVEIGV